MVYLSLVNMSSFAGFVSATQVRLFFTPETRADMFNLF